MSNKGAAFRLSGWKTCDICGQEFYGYKKNICDYCKDIINSKLRRKKMKKLIKSTLTTK